MRNLFTATIATTLCAMALDCDRAQDGGGGGGGKHIPVAAVSLHKHPQEVEERYVLSMREGGHGQREIEGDLRDSILMDSGEKWGLRIEIQPPDATDKRVTWKSSDQAVATVDENGVITAVGFGGADITATTVDGGKSDTIGVSVDENVSE